MFFLSQPVPQTPNRSFAKGRLLAAGGNTGYRLCECCSWNTCRAWPSCMLDLAAARRLGWLVSFCTRLLH